jgi:hypothetical protein
MKKKLAFAAFVAAAAVAITVMVGGAAGSGGPIAQEQGFACNVFDASGNLFTTNISGETLFSSGKDLLHCVGFGAGDGTIHYFNFGNTGLLCGTLFGGFTDNWSDKVSKSGESQLTCTATVVVTSAPAKASSGTAGIG